MQFQIGAASACFTAVTAFGLLAGIRLLPGRTPAWYGVIVAAAVMLAVLLFSGWALVVPLGLAAGGCWAGPPGEPRPVRLAGLPLDAAKRQLLRVSWRAVCVLRVPPAAPPPARP